MQNKGTGELSFLTCFMNFVGSIGKLKVNAKLVTKLLFFTFGSFLFSYYYFIYVFFKLNSISTSKVHIYWIVNDLK